MSLIQTVWRCTFSPRLYKIYEFTWLNNIVDKPYEPKNLERWGDQVITSFVTMWSLGLYTFPLVAILVYRRITPVFDFYSLTKFMAGAGLILVTSLVARGYSRASNPLYMKFIKILQEAKVRNESEARRELNKYDFEFWASPVDFQVARIDGGVRKQKQTLEKFFNSRSNSRRQTSKEFIATLPCKIISYVTAHTVAVKLMYPGSIGFMNWILRTTQIQGRSDLIKRGAERYKIGTSDGNYLDTIFINRKNSRLSNGDVLVITCEGNCGFYETGVIGTPISCGYSVLGWNHPGFANSTSATVLEEQVPSNQGEQRTAQNSVVPIEIQGLEKDVQVEDVEMENDIQVEVKGQGKGVQLEDVGPEEEMQREVPERTENVLLGNKGQNEPMDVDTSERPSTPVSRVLVRPNKKCTWKEIATSSPKKGNYSNNYNPKRLNCTIYKKG